MKKSIFLKLFGGFLLIILVLALFIFVLSSRSIKSFYLDTLARDLEHLGGALKFKIIQFLEEGQHTEMDAFIKEFGKSINTRITIIRNDGLILADSEEDPGVMENHRKRPEVYKALTGEIGRSLRYSTTVKAEMLYIGQPIIRNGEVSDVLRVSLYVRDINELFSDLRLNIGQIVLVITLISLLGALIFSRSLSKPIRELRDASKRVASGDFSTRVYLKKRDELKELADGFNQMTEQISSLFAELTRQKAELDSILTSMAEGLLALDSSGRILFSNESFQKITQADFVEGKYYWEVLRETQFDDLIKRVLEEKRNFTEEISHDERVFLCSVNYVGTRGEVVITLHDITEIKQVERIKKDFVMNVSHELRTPLTAIKGFVETLEEEVDEKSKSYIDIIKRNTDRLINIVKDLLLLSELEEEEVELEREEVDVKRLIENILKIFDQSLREKGLDVEFRAAEQVPLIKGDPFQLEQMFINIIDNAVKYTEKGTITISIKQIKRMLSVGIQDTGIGIPEEHLSRIFERFFVIDKSRSREMGGTGLGLSIVKHIVHLHKGKIEVESIPREGTKFTVMLPV